MRRELSEGVALRDDLGQRPEPEAHDSWFEHGGRERRWPVKRRAVGGVAGRPPELPSRLLSGSEAPLTQREDVIPSVTAREPVDLPDESVEIPQREQRAEVIAQGVTVSTASTMNTSVSPGPMTLPAPRSP